MQNTTSHILYKYWNEIRDGRLAPRRFEIEPARVATILPETFVIECEQGEEPRFRLAGTRITDKLGFELRTRPFSDLVRASEHAQLKPLLVAVIEQGAVGILALEMSGPSGRTALFEVIILPLIHTADRVTRLLGAISTRAHEPWLGTEPLSPGRIVTRETVWPDGRPHAVAERMTPPPPPFKHDLSESRLVRDKRRLFRVYDGGR